MNNLPIENYDVKGIQEILEEITSLDRSELLRIREHEIKHENRGRVLEAIQAELRGPIDGYRNLSVDEILEQLDNYCKKDLERILDYEQHHKTRTELVNAIHQRMPYSSC